jgi:hypothetical protein
MLKKQIKSKQKVYSSSELVNHMTEQTIYIHQGIGSTDDLHPPGDRVSRRSTSTRGWGQQTIYIHQGMGPADDLHPPGDGVSRRWRIVSLRLILRRRRKRGNLITSSSYLCGSSERSYNRNHSNSAPFSRGFKFIEIKGHTKF